jgi:DNA-binding transcriptional MerR regulator
MEGAKALIRRFTRVASIKNKSKSDGAVSISAAANITGVEVYTLRYWEKEFDSFLNPNRTEGGQRRYRPQDIQTVFAIKRLLRDEMFSIAGARRHLAKLFESQQAA